jgi:nucleoside phosphorylase
MIAILVAVEQELRPILDRAAAHDLVRQGQLDFHEGLFAGQPVAILALGVGKACARLAAEMTIKCYRPDLIISAGFGGALRTDLAPGDVVVGTEVLELTQDQGQQVRWEPVTASYLVPPEVAGVAVQRGVFLTTDEIILRGQRKQHLGRATGACVGEMETSAVARVCAEHGTPLLAVRGVTDHAREDLPAQMNEFFVLGQLQLWRILSICNRHPRVVLDLLRLSGRARRAGANLARYLEAVLPRLTPH